MALKCVEQQANRACLLSPQYEDGQPKRFIRQMTSFFVINNITADRHVAYLLAALPSKIYNTMEELTAPELPEDVSYEELVVKLETLEIRKSSLISRYEFGKTYRCNEESIQTFAHRVIRAAQECKFLPSERDGRLRDQFIIGVNDGAVLRAILRGEDALSFDDCVKTASVIVQTRLDAACLSVNEEVNASYIRRKKEMRCFNCESLNHFARECTSLCKKCSHKHAAKDCYKRRQHQENLKGTSSH